MTFAPEYVSSVLSDNFEDAKARFVDFFYVEQQLVAACGAEADAIRASTRLLEEDRAWLDGRRVALSEASRHLEEGVCAL